MYYIYDISRCHYNNSYDIFYSYLSSVQAVLLVADAKNTFELTGNGDVLEPQSGVMGETAIPTNM